MRIQSVYKTIWENINSEGRLPSKFELLNEEAAPNEIRFVAGARDGIGIFHAAPHVPEKAVNEIYELLISGETDGITPLIKEYRVLQIIDPLLNLIHENASDAVLPGIEEYAEALAFRSNDEEMVKLGISLLGIFDWSDKPSMQKMLITLGLYEELTLYVVVAAYEWENGNEVIFEIAQKVAGWGKIHAVERLEPVNDEIREWILREGCQNSVLDSYLGLTCAVKGDLIGALRRDSLDAGLYESISIIINALMDDPEDGIHEYAYTEEALLRYLQFSGQYAATAKHLWHILRVETQLEELALSNKASLLKACSEIKNRPVWRELIQTTLADPWDENFFYAANTAGRLSMDVQSLIYNAIKQDPIEKALYLSMAYENPEYAKELTVLYENVLPLGEIASGMGDSLFAQTLIHEHICLDYVLRELRKYPQTGEQLLIATLRSPIIRERRAACVVLDEWTKTLAQPLQEVAPGLSSILEEIAPTEVDSDTEKVMKKLLGI